MVAPPRGGGDGQHAKAMFAKPVGEDALFPRLLIRDQFAKETSAGSFAGYGHGAAVSFHEVNGVFMLVDRVPPVEAKDGVRDDAALGAAPIVNLPLERLA